MGEMVANFKDAEADCVTGTAPAANEEASPAELDRTAETVLG